MGAWALSELASIQADLMEAKRWIHYIIVYQQPFIYDGSIDFVHIKKLGWKEEQIQFDARNIEEADEFVRLNMEVDPVEHKGQTYRRQPVMLVTIRVIKKYP